MLISVLKDSSLASLISAPDIMLRANDITHGPPPGSAHAPGAGSKADVEDHLEDDELRRDPVMQVLAGKLAARRSA